MKARISRACAQRAGAHSVRGVRGCAGASAPEGVYVKLSQVTDLYQTSGRYVVLHNGARRVQTITANVSGRDVKSFVSDAQAAIASNVAMPAGSYVEFTGAAAAQAQSTHDLVAHSLLADTALVLLLSTVMGSRRNLLLV